MSTIRVVLADDHPLVLAEIKALIQSAPDMALVGAATNGTAAVALIRHAKPTVAVVDLSLPGDRRHRTGARNRQGTAPGKGAGSDAA